MLSIARLYLSQSLCILSKLKQAREGTGHCWAQDKPPGLRRGGRASVHCALSAQVRNELHSYSQNKAGSPRLASPPTCKCSKSRCPRAGGQLGAKGHCRQGGLPALPVGWEGTTVNTRRCRWGLAPAFLQVWLPFT